MKERPSFERPSFQLRERGSFTSRGERVYAGTPAALHPMRDDQPVNRLGLARWLVDENNPLAARVAVNRLWEQLFGRGIVETSEDFGTQGAPPSHPELLDWLATEFIAKGWSQKALIRDDRAVGHVPAVVGGDAGARGTRSVQPAAGARSAGPDGGRDGPRRRAGGERPAQPEDGRPERVSAAAATASGTCPYSSDKWTTSEGEDRYRRSLYTFWRRTSPYPSFMTFDATSREFCTVRRVRTNTPLQALTLLNDPASFEAARALAARMIATPGGDAAVARGVRRHSWCCSRAAKPARARSPHRDATSRSSSTTGRATRRPRARRGRSD